jgi:ABC-type amino acid transport system permease subunit
MARLEYVDIWRGIPLIVMVFIQIFDYLWTRNIYTDAPFYVPEINSITWVPPAWLFTFVVGISVFLLIEKLGDKASIKAVAKRYLPYVLISLPFTVVMWSLSTWLGWEEAIQGLGLTAVFAAAVLLRKPKTKHLLLLVIGTSILHVLLNSVPLGLERFPSSFSATSAAALLANILWRGWFSVTNLLPFMLAGVVFFKPIRGGKSLAKVGSFAGLFVLAAVALHLIGFPIDFYGRSFGHILFGIGQSALLCIGTLVLWQKSQNSILWRPLKTMGSLAFVIYIGHYLLILKVLELIGLKDSFPEIISLVFTMIFMVSAYLGAETYLLAKKISKRA